jgi:hypothetical protein
MSLVAAAESSVEALLADLLVEIRGLRADLNTHVKVGKAYRSGTLLSRSDLALLGRLLPVIGATVGSEPFLVRDLFEHPSAALRLVFRKLNTRQVGRLLRRAEGQAVDGYLVEQTGDELGAKLWRVAKFLGNEKVSVPPQASRSLS